MARSTHARPAVGHSTPIGGSVAGSIGLLVLLAAGLVAASYPQVALATAVGAVGAHLTRRGVRALRSQLGDRRLASLAARFTPGSPAQMQ